MPIYEYQCKQCGERVEKRQNISEDPLTVCEKCHGRLEKQVSLSGFQFKGAGWYVTDYAGSKKDPSKEKSSSGESTVTSDSASNTTKDAATTPAKTESKPAASTSKDS